MGLKKNLKMFSSKTNTFQSRRYFSSDERNSGGRTLITQLLYNHYNALLNAKPTIKIFKENSTSNWSASNSQISNYRKSSRPSTCKSKMSNRSYQNEDHYNN